MSEIVVRSYNEINDALCWFGFSVHSIGYQVILEFVRTHPMTTSLDLRPCFVDRPDSIPAKIVKIDSSNSRI